MCKFVDEYKATTNTQEGVLVPPGLPDTSSLTTMPSSDFDLFWCVPPELSYRKGKDLDQFKIAVPSVER